MAVLWLPGMLRVWRRHHRLHGKPLAFIAPPTLERQVGRGENIWLGWGDGWVRRRIRQSSFAYASPLAHAYGLRGIVVVFVLSGLVLFLPLPLPAFGVPVVGALVAVLVGVIVANAQKRL